MKRVLLSEIRIIYQNEDGFVDETYSGAGIVNWEPAYDLYIADDTIFINIELPGVDIHDITIYVGNNNLMISGTKKPFMKESEEMSRNNLIFHTLEISYGKFSRHIDFPIPIEPKKGVYNFINGVLRMKFPVQKERVIPIEEV